LKGQVWEGGHRVPAIAYWKDHAYYGNNNQPVMSMDIFPTVVDLLGDSHLLNTNFDIYINHKPDKMKTNKEKNEFMLKHTLIIIAGMFLFFSCIEEEGHVLFSPDQNHKFILNTNNDRLTYHFISYGDTVVKNSRLGFGIRSSMETGTHRKKYGSTNWKVMRHQSR